MARQKVRRKPQTNRLRIIAGQWRGRRLSFPDVPGLRPTTDRVRETVFNWLQPRLPGAHCLDLFAGSGALGLEALSRGAAEVEFVEQDARAAAGLRANFDVLGAEGASLCQQDALDWLAQANGQPFDIVFLDPPFRQGLLRQCLTGLVAGGCLQDGSLIYLEMEKVVEQLELPPGYRLLKEKQAGQVCSRLLEFRAA